MAIIDSFSIQAGDNADLLFEIDLEDGITLADSEVYFAVYAQAYGIPDLSGGVVFLKSTIEGNVTVIGSPGNQFTVSIVPADTVDLLHNYYFEAKVVDINGNNSTVTAGIMCVEPTAIAPV